MRYSSPVRITYATPFTRPVLLVGLRNNGLFQYIRWQLRKIPLRQHCQNQWLLQMDQLELRQ